MKALPNILYLSFFLAMLFSSCEDMLEQKPQSGLLPDEAVQDAEDLQQVLTSAYDVLANTYDGDAQNLMELPGDNLIRPVQFDDYTEVWLRQSTIFNGTISAVLRDWYIAVLRANTVMENLDAVTGLSANDATRIEAEARFIRALCHFDVVRTFAQPYGYTSDNSHPGIAIRTATDVSNVPRSSVAEVYNFIIDDLTFAINNLPNGQSVYATKQSAQGLMAEVQFQMHNYQQAYEYSDEVINSGYFELDTAVNRYYISSVSPEAVFYIYSAEIGENIDSRNSAFRDSYNSLGVAPRLRLQPSFYEDLVSFQGPRAELYAEREQDGNIFHVTTMFNQQFFNIPVISLTQLMLTRAESAAELNQHLEVVYPDINAIRNRAYGNTVAGLDESSTAQDILEAARMERRYELPFTGDRTQQLKRMGSQGEDISVRGVPYDCNGMILQFPSIEQTDFFELNPTGGC